MIGEILTILGAAIFGMAVLVGWIKLLIESFRMGDYIQGFIFLGLGILLMGIVFLCPAF